ncbi:unnamed protein product [Nezara viridula]|uniref:Coiled-coil domain-containing protein 181 n=1 Tax=Nezara viridula TaxID=85310 RepID=A0A9P0MVP2_NEZVI|nr:unnamed protein product [Nezara viridula]
MNKRKQKNTQDDSRDKNRRKYDYDDLDEEDDDDFGIPLSPGGSVLMPSPNPYNMSDRIKKANQQLEEEKKRAALSSRIPKVRFVDPIALEEEDVVVGQGTQKKPPPTHEHESKPSKILLVTLPTAYSIESEEILTDDDYEDDLDLNTDDFRGSRNNQESSVAKFYESEEEVEDSTLPLTEETITSSLETVLCRSETEESELTESFTKSINLNTENELINSVPIDNIKSINDKESLDKTDDLVKEVIEILEKSDSIEKSVSSEPLSDQMITFEASNSNKVSVIRNLKSDFSATKPLSKPIPVKKRITAVDLRPSTAPAKRMCCKIGVITKLPAYNGLRSEYGLSKEQLLEKEKKKYELSKALRIEKEKKWMEERQKQKENEIMFKNWLIKKKKEAEAKTLRKLQQSNYCFRTTPAPTSHLDKIGALRRKMLRQENTFLLLDKIFRNARPQEQKTYRIYLGLCV